MRALVTGGNRYIGLHLAPRAGPAGPRRDGDQQPRGGHPARGPAHPLRPPRARRDRRRARRRTATTSTSSTTTRPTTSPTCEPMVELFTGRVAALRVHQLVGRRTGAASCSRSPRRSAPTPPTDRRRRARPTASARCRCEQYLAGQHEDGGLPATVLRVAHTLGPMSPLASRASRSSSPGSRPAGRSSIPGEGFPFVHLVHVADVAACMAPIAGNDRAPGQIYNVAGARGHEHPRAVRMMAAGRRRRARHRPRAARRRPLAARAR